MSQPFYITTPIYYVNDVPHLGHAYSTMVADALARFHRMRGDHTWFLTGTDEHGQKVEETAIKRGLTPHELVDQVAPRFAEVWRQLGITNDDFIRTTEPRHKAIVAELWKRIAAAGDLYLASYQGWYCVPCEAFYTESQLVKLDGDDAWCCAIHKKPVAYVDKERSWFFRLANFADPLLEHIAAHPEFIQPEAYRNEIVAFLRSGLRDLSVSRTSFAWGIAVPEPDPEGKHHVIYVWLDALVNYYSALCDPGKLGGPRVDELWPSAVHLIGKDILRFHAVYWPAFLMSAGLPLPRTIMTHGWWTVRGEKISKSMPATRIDPLKLAEALGAPSTFGLPIGIDAMRYYLMREVPLGNDGDFTFESLFSRYNAELANDLGNLINRTLTGIIHKTGGPVMTASFNQGGAHAELIAAAEATIAQATAHFTALAPSRALEAIWVLVRQGNRYIDATQPWTLAKNEATRAEASHVMHNLFAILDTVAGLVMPVLPTAGKLLRGWLGVPADRLERWPTAAELVMPRDGAAIPTDIKPMFPRLDDKLQAELLAKIVPADNTPAPIAPAPTVPTGQVEKPTITFDEFAKLELRTGKIVSAAAVPKAKKLLHLSIDLGEAKPRSVVAGIAEKYAPGELVGKQVIVVANLAPATIRGIASEAMILAAGDDSIVGLSALDFDVPPGTRVR